MDHPGSKKAWRPLVTILALALVLLGCSAPTESPKPPAPRDAGEPLTVPRRTTAAPAPATDLATQSPAAEATAIAAATAPAPSGHDHDHFRTLPVDIARSFAAFTLSFDGKDGGQCLGVPEWVAYELRATPAGLGKAPNRPSKWATDPALHQQGIAPDDDSYKGSDYSRGHMCMKSHAHRISAAADTETHTVLNACPQLQGMNNGVWKSIEDLTGTWADVHGRVWIVTGPVFLPNRPRNWIGDAGEVPIAVPDAFFKVVAKERANTCDVLAFLVPMEGDARHTKGDADLHAYLTSVDIVEALTGMDLLTSLADPLEETLEKRIFTDLWPTGGAAPSPLGLSPTAPRAPPTTAVVQPVAPLPLAAAAAPDPLAGVSLRAGYQATAAEAMQAKKLKRAGWEYVMPRPKSAQAAWGNRDGRTTWWSGYWRNSTTGGYSVTVPNEADGWKGDGVQSTGWRRGGSPSAPAPVEWLCSTSGGVAPR